MHLSLAHCPSRVRPPFASSQAAVQNMHLSLAHYLSRAAAQRRRDAAALSVQAGSPLEGCGRGVDATDAAAASLMRSVDLAAWRPDDGDAGNGGGDDDGGGDGGGSGGGSDGGGSASSGSGASSNHGCSAEWKYGRPHCRGQVDGAGGGGVALMRSLDLLAWRPDGGTGRRAAAGDNGSSDGGDGSGGATASPGSRGLALQHGCADASYTGSPQDSPRGGVAGFAYGCLTLPRAASPGVGAAQRRSGSVGGVLPSMRSEDFSPRRPGGAPGSSWLPRLAGLRWPWRAGQRGGASPPIAVSSSRRLDEVRNALFSSNDAT
eukprot:355734-Chlamydomonas_euryale.AAC.2